MLSTLFSTSQGTKTFQGFEPLTANYIYCPNQFFDVCLPNYPRGVVRLVGYILYKTLSHLDENGNPVRQNFTVTYQQLIDEAGISRGAITNVIKKAIEGKFIRKIASGTHALCWDDGDYTTSLKFFNGFYSGDGNRSPIPSDFFTQVIRHERLSVAKVVGIVLRHTVGYQNQFGTGRRLQHPLSYSYIQKATNIRHRPTLADAIRSSLRNDYICIAKRGYFDPQGGTNNRPTSYSVKWLTQAESNVRSTKTEPASQKYKNRTGTSTKTEPVKQFKNRTYRKKIEQKEQQQHGVGDLLSAAAETSKSIQILCDEGFDENAARGLATIATFGEIQKQIAWIDLRGPKNRLGMLRKAIEQKWGEPLGAKEREAKQRSRKREQERRAKEAREQAEQQAEADRKRERLQQLRTQFLKQPLSIREQLLEQALTEAPTDFQRNFIRPHGCDDNVSTDVLSLFARTLTSG